MEIDKTMIKAIRTLAIARRRFESAVAEKLILGNDNHIGDIGEYWVRKYLESADKFRGYAPKKNSPFDLEMTDGSKVSVKTISRWSRSGHGTQVKPLCGTNWDVLAAVSLNKDLYAEKIALVPLAELVMTDTFKRNEQRRQTKDTSAYPRFEWWCWLENYVVYRHSQFAPPPTPPRGG